ncbi:hypothetical protein [Methylobacterium brachythecii]|uniref:MarR family transcriptional regulator n=1 Tax=Methylobacterium brachythecii TaxID=1176177 RepID=A0ABQ6D1L6_9HYPH|nr:hypothetical protein [Methylobacterium brachythecii]GLS44232.1 hypothetical protein GCM10007884_22200 [Methylobacterium brachythecii]
MILTKRQLNALLSIKLNPRGLHKGSSAVTMPALVEVGLVEERPKYRRRPGETAWFLTIAGLKALANAEPSEVRSPDRH